MIKKYEWNAIHCTIIISGYCVCDGIGLLYTGSEKACIRWWIVQSDYLVHSSALFYKKTHYIILLQMRFEQHVSYYTYGLHYWNCGYRASRWSVIWCIETTETLFWRRSEQSDFLKCNTVYHVMWRCWCNIMIVWHPDQSGRTHQLNGAVHWFMSNKIERDICML